MNTKIFNLLIENLQESFKLKKYSDLFSKIDKNTEIDKLPWTPARYSKFKTKIENTLHLETGFIGTVEDITNELDTKYCLRFFGEIWQPRTDDYNFTGWELAADITRQDPQSVLDVGCGYHPFKTKIPNLIGIDPYNQAADYMVDILEYRVEPGSHDHIIALGSINFNSEDDIRARFSHCVNLLKTGGRFYLRANPGIPHKTGPWVDIFPWSFEIVKQFEQDYNLHLDTFKKDSNNRLFFSYTKL